MGTASKALGDIVRKPAVVSLESVNAVPLGRISKPLEEPGAASAAVVAAFSGELSGKVLLMIPWNDALALCDLAQHPEPGTSKEFDGERQVLLKALGTVLAHTYIDTIAGRLGSRGTEAERCSSTATPDPLHRRGNVLGGRERSGVPFAIET